MKTSQQVFDTTLNHLRKQGHAAVQTDTDGNTGCMYRAPNGDSCAVGCQIADDDYDPAIEESGVMSTRWQLREVLKVSGLAEHVVLLDALQRAHDGMLRYEGMQAWEEEMERLAAQHNLTYTPDKAIGAAA